MALETGTYISDLVATNPLSSDLKSQGDDHIRLIKSTLQATFPNIDGEVDRTPAQLNKAGVAASETVTGIAEIATQAETNAGTDDARIVTPLKLRSGFAISLGSAGYIKFPTWMGGLIIQWGVATGTGLSLASAYPIAFPNAVLQASAVLKDKTAGATGGISLYIPDAVFSSTTVITARAVGTDSVGTTTARFVAIGH
jgi:hypothetical protein